MQQIDARAVAIKDLPPELSADVDRFRIYVDQRNASAGGKHDLRDLLAEAAVPDDNHIGLRRQFRIIKLHFARLLAGRKPAREDHQERGRRH